MRSLTAIKRFLNSDDATTAVEYAVLLAMILIALVIGVTSAGGGVSSWWTNIKTKVTSY
jgi:pilus assembly protein Flp/PilA